MDMKCSLATKKRSESYLDLKLVNKFSKQLVILSKLNCCHKIWCLMWHGHLKSLSHLKSHSIHLFIAISNGVFTCKYLKSNDKVGAFVSSEWGTTISSNVFIFWAEFLIKKCASIVFIY